jgi:alkylation response protein AidB-like acyl-CoA dehydrogenase
VTKVDDARALADEFLFPTANEVDALPVVPRERLDRLAADGWYGLAAPDAGIQLSDAWPILAAFAGGCLTTTLVWTQHHGVLAACAFGPETVHHWVAPMASGDVRASVAFAGLLPAPKLRARPDGDSWVIDGTAPWVSGWGLVDVVHVATRAPDDDVVWLLVDASADGLRAEPHRLLGLDASATVTLHFDGVRVAGDRMTSRFPWSEWPARDAAGLRTNGSIALGVAERCCRLLGPSSLDDELARVTAQLDAGDAGTYPHARADASALAVRAATALVVDGGSGAVERGTHAERLYREAAMVLVFGSRPSIRAELLKAVMR